MRQRPRNSFEASNVEGNQEVDDTSTNVQEDSWTMPHAQILSRTSYVILTLFALIAYCSWSVFHYQYQRLPVPLGAEEAGKRGFSEMEAMNHLNALTQLGPHPVGSDALVHAIKYVHGAAEMIKNASHWEVEVEVDQFHVKDGAHNILGGLFTGKTLVYADLNHIVMRITPKYASEVKENSILVSSHIDTVFSTGGAGDCSSCVAVMLELARAVSHWAHGLKSSVIFLFNTGEEEGLNGAHSFITQHPWRDTVRIAIDLEAMGIGGKSGIFQAGPHPGAIESFASVAKYPSANIMAQDLFASGIIKSSTDFLIYKEVGGLSGLDFAYTDNTAVYHTKNDKVELLEPGSLQHLGENMLAFLVHAASSPLEKHETVGAQVNPDHDSAIYFDILGSYMIVYRWGFANMLHNSVIMQSLLIWIMSLLMGGYTAAVSLVLSFLSIILMWILSISFSILVVFILPNLSWSAVPYITNPWLVVGLFGCPSLLGAFAGQHLGFLLLKEYLSHTYSKRYRTLSPSDQDDMAKLEAERWLFKSGTVQWLLILMAANYYKVGSSYIPLIWLVTPAFSYGLLEATLSPLRSPKPLKIATLLIALSVPLIVTSGAIMRIIGVFIGMAVRFDRNPGGSSEWFVSLIVSVIVAAVVCLMLVYVLSYIHLSGDKRSIILVICLLIGLSLAAVQSGIIPAYTDDLSRAVNVIHVVDSMGHQGKDGLTSYVSLFSSTPGNLTKEINHINEGFECGRDKMVDFVTFSMKYGCWTYDETESGWSQLDVPTLHVNSDRKAEERVTVVSIDTKVSRRWALAINTEKIADFKIQVSGDSDQLVSLGSKRSIDGEHVIQFSGGQNAPTKFDITLIWAKNSTQYSGQMGEDKEKYLLKLRTDVDRVTPKVERVLTKLPSWCALFGKSTSPFTLAFLAGLPIDI